MVSLDPSQGRWAVSLARSVIESAVEGGDGRSTLTDAAIGNGSTVPQKLRPEDLLSDHSQEDSLRDVDPVFETERGVFVTLEKDGALRGCIGRPRAEQPAIEALVESAVGAATDDPRFPPVAPDELDSITVEVSVLTPPEPLEVDEPSAYPEAIAVGRDGLIVYGDGRSGLLLPQVPVEQDWGPEAFLAGTCRKAGLPVTAWRDPDVTIETFQAQIFSEQEPGGPVVGSDPAMEPGVQEP